MYQRRCAAVLLLAALLSGGCAPAAGGVSDPIPPEPQEVFSAADPTAPAPQEVSSADDPAALERAARVRRPEQESLMKTVDALCAAPRPLGSPEERAAAAYLRDQLQAYGYTAALEAFPYDITTSTLSQRYRQARTLSGDDFFAAALPGTHKDGESGNVVGRTGGEDGRKILALSAHYDSTPGSLGVLDNATGVAVVLEAARILAGEELPFDLMIVFFGGEEEILLGSRQHLLAMDPGERGRIVGNINVDTLAYSADPVFTALTPLLPEQENARALSGQSPVAAALLADERVSPAFRSQLVGDYIAYHQAGIDSVNFGQSMDAVAAIINTPQDTYDNLVPELLPAATQLLVDAVRRYAGAGQF